MSVDFYVSVPKTNWPTPIAMQQCMTTHGLSAKIKIFPAFQQDAIVSTGIIATVDGQDIYLEGELAHASVVKATADDINNRLKNASASDRIGNDDALLSLRVGTLPEVRAVTYVVSALILCFDGFGFEPQGNSYGRKGFAHTMLQGVEMMKDM